MTTYQYRAKWKRLIKSTIRKQFFELNSNQKFIDQSKTKMASQPTYEENQTAFGT